MQKMKFRPLALSAMSFGLIAVGSMVAAENHHHNNDADGQTPVVQGGGMSGMGGMGGDQMAMMQSMMQMHMSMMLQMAQNGQISALFEDSAPDAALAAFDTNGDGMLNLDEFAAWDSQALRGMMVDRFQHIDADGSGDVSSEELLAASASKSGMGQMSDMGGDMDGMSGDMENMDEMKEAEGDD